LEFESRKLAGHKLLPDIGPGLRRELLKASLVPPYHLKHLLVVGVRLASHQFLEVSREEVVVVVLLRLDVL
jgi:hypothetical protein